MKSNTPNLFNVLKCHIHMTTQYYIVLIVILIAVIYAAQRIKQTIKSSKSGCYGCKGCALREQIIKKEKEKGYKTTKKACFKKKD